MDNFNLQDPLTRIEEQQSGSISVLFSSESDYMPSRNYFQCLKTSDLHASFRREAISLILKAQYYCNLDLYTQYLAINYMDRFISWQEIPLSNPRVLRLLVIACISLAGKMKEIHLSFSDFQMKQREERFIFDPPAIQRMELLVLDALKWRMRS
ncbi:cyclin-D1-1-like [Hibiscus syriacus]|uniref:cyclin-D1-1-like n=1 Tax=Hibiscus syriacus TaxID=106335 RepID=UPI001921E440|nr:cyclin-D1-1-like [Hibiscus syriacus]